MLWMIFWVAISLFAVIGLLECMMFLLELFAFHKANAIEEITLQVVLKGEEENVEFLLNSLALVAERADIGKRETALEIVDGGISQEMRRAIEQYCEKNTWVRFTRAE